MKVQDRPHLYDWLYQDELDDIPMYIKLSEGYNTVLECGIGSGRIAIPMAKAGRRVYGIDNSQSMLDMLDEKLSRSSREIREAIIPCNANMTNFDLNLKFSFIYVPFSTFNYLLSIDEQKACLRAVRNHLEPGGTLVLELLSYSYNSNWLLNDLAMKLAKVGPNNKTGGKIELWKLSSFDSANQIVTEDRHFRFFDANGLFEKEEVNLWINRFMFLGEIQLLFEICKFQIVNIYGDFSFGDYKHDSQICVVEARSQ